MIRGLLWLSLALVGIAGAARLAPYLDPPEPPSAAVSGEETTP